MRRCTPRTWAGRRARTERWTAATARCPSRSAATSLCTSSAREVISSATHPSQRRSSGPQVQASAPSISAPAMPSGSWSTTASRQPGTAVQTEPGASISRRHASDGRDLMETSSPPRRSSLKENVCGPTARTSTSESGPASPRARLPTRTAASAPSPTSPSATSRATASAWSDGRAGGTRAGCLAGVQGRDYLRLLRVKGVEVHAGLGGLVGLLVDLVQEVGFEHRVDDLADLIARELQLAALVELPDAGEDLHERSRLFEPRDGAADRLELVGGQVLEEVEVRLLRLPPVLVSPARFAVGPGGGG